MSALLPDADQSVYERAVKALRAKAHGIPLATAEYGCAWSLARALAEGDEDRATDLARRLGIELGEVRE